MDELLEEYEQEAARWQVILTRCYGEEFAEAVLPESRLVFKSFVEQLPYIGGEESWTDSLIDSARCLALYRVLSQHGLAAREVGRLLFEAVLLENPAHPGSITATAGNAAQSQLEEEPPTEKIQVSAEKRMQMRRQRACNTQLRRYPDDYVAEFIAGDGADFDYGYDIMECAALKFYVRQTGMEFMPYYCHLDFAYSLIHSLGLQRTKNLALGDDCCNPRFKQGRSTKVGWLPPFQEG